MSVGVRLPTTTTCSAAPRARSPLTRGSYPPVLNSRPPSQSTTTAERSAFRSRSPSKPRPPHRGCRRRRWGWQRCGRRLSRAAPGCRCSRCRSSAGHPADDRDLGLGPHPRDERFQGAAHVVHLVAEGLVVSTSSAISITSLARRPGAPPGRARPRARRNPDAERQHRLLVLVEDRDEHVPFDRLSG